MVLHLVVALGVCRRRAEQDEDWDEELQARSLIQL
jgi:hypothetical protein